MFKRSLVFLFLMSGQGSLLGMESARDSSLSEVLPNAERNSLISQASRLTGKFGCQGVSFGGGELLLLSIAHFQDLFGVQENRAAQIPEWVSTLGKDNSVNTNFQHLRAFFLETSNSQLLGITDKKLNKMVESKAINEQQKEQIKDRIVDHITKGSKLLGNKIIEGLIANETAKFDTLQKGQLEEQKFKRLIVGSSVVAFSLGVGGTLLYLKLRGR